MASHQALCNCASSYVHCSDRHGVCHVLALDSRFGLIPAVLMAVRRVRRTDLDDRRLHNKLAGYPGYASNTRVAWNLLTIEFASIEKKP